MAISLSGRLAGPRRAEAKLGNLVMVVKVALAPLVSRSADFCESEIDSARLGSDAAQY